MDKATIHLEVLGGLEPADCARLASASATLGAFAGDEELWKARHDVMAQDKA